MSETSDEYWRGYVDGRESLTQHINEESYDEGYEHGRSEGNAEGRRDYGHVFDTDRSIYFDDEVLYIPRGGELMVVPLDRPWDPVETQLHLPESAREVTL